MSNQPTQNRIGGKDLINAGIFTAIIFIITMVIMPLRFIPVLMPLYCVIIPWMLFVSKVRHFGLILIMSLLLGIPVSSPVEGLTGFF